MDAPWVPMVTVPPRKQPWCLAWSSRSRALWVRAGRLPCSCCSYKQPLSRATQALCLLCLAVVLDKVESAWNVWACMECVSIGGVANAWLLVCPGVVGPYAVLRRVEQQPAHKPATTNVCCKPGTILPSLEMCVLHALLDFGGFTTSVGEPKRRCDAHMQKPLA